MKIGIFADIHGNLIALEKIIKYFKRNNIENIIHLGDTIDIGPYPIETLDYLKTLDNCEMIMGNHEFYKITKIPDDVGEEEFKHQSWVNNLLKEEHLNWLKLFPKIITKEIYGKKYCFLHNNYDDNGNELINIPYKNTVELELYFKILMQIIFSLGIHILNIYLIEIKKIIVIQDQQVVQKPMIHNL